MKWPLSVTLARHAESAYNELRKNKQVDPQYQQFVAEYEKDHRSSTAQALAHIIRQRYVLGCSDFDTPITQRGKEQARVTGKRLHETIPAPDIVFYSPYERTCDTFFEMQQEWPELKAAKAIEDDRIREQEHGLSLLYSDWRVFHVLHPEQKALREMLGPYWYQYPQGESVAQVRDRTRSMTTTIIRECQNQHVFLMTHHLTILSWRANLERLTPLDFIDLDENDKPVNCGITHYVGNPRAGSDGRLELEFYNKKLY